MASVRPYKDRDRDVIVRLSLLAWTPVFESTREQMGDELFRRRLSPCRSPHG